MEINCNHAEIAGALRPIRRAKNVFLFLILLALLTQAAAFIAVQFFGVIDDAGLIRPLRELKALTAADGSAEVWFQILRWGLMGTQFVAVVCSLLLMITLMFAAALSLLAGGHGSRKLFGAWFWSLILLALLTPWQSILGIPLAHGMLFSLSELAPWVYRMPAWSPNDSVVIRETIFFYGRFLGYPGIALLLWVFIVVQFAGGYRHMAAAFEAIQADSVEE